MSSVRCCSCNKDYLLNEFEAHVCTEHLEYYPYGCGHCAHWLPTEQLVHFHAQKKSHLPIKIRENPDITKERRLREIIESSTGDKTISNASQNNQFSWQLGGIRNNASPGGIQVGRIDSSHRTSTPCSTTSNSESLKSKSFANIESFQFNGTSNQNAKIGDKQSADHKRWRKRKKPQRYDLEEREDDIEKKNKNDQPLDFERKLCNICQIEIERKDGESHIRSHIMSRPLAGCNYCNYKGKNNCSVRVHITWKHITKSAKMGIGVIDLSEVNASLEDMFDTCFGEQKSGESHIDAVTVYKSPRKMTEIAVARATVQFQTPPVQTSNAGQFNRNRSTVAKQTAICKFQTNPDQSLVTRTTQSASGRIYKHMLCVECGSECMDALASAHIYMTHINMKDMIQCSYCHYGATYAISEVKRHITAKHPHQTVTVIDRRQDPDMQSLYVKWRNRCFPMIGNRRMGTNHSTSVTSNEKKESKNDNLWSQLFSKKDQPENNATEETLRRLNARQKKECLKCGEVVTVLWMHRHVWKHLSDDYGINGLKCAVNGCHYTTYLRRSLDCHCRQHGGQTTDQLGLIDERNKYNDEYKACLIECFDDDIPQDVTDAFYSPTRRVNAALQSSAHNIETVITATSIMEIWCQKCQCGFDKNEADDHIWQVHLDGVLPFRCGKCSQSFLDLTKMESHWMNKHKGCDNDDEMEVIEEPDALGHFENMLIECFPDLIAQKQIKIEPDSGI